MEEHGAVNQDYIPTSHALPHQRYLQAWASDDLDLKGDETNRWMKRGALEPKREKKEIDGIHAGWCNTARGVEERIRRSSVAEWLQASSVPQRAMERRGEEDWRRWERETNKSASPKQAAAEEMGMGGWVCW